MPVQTLGGGHAGAIPRRERARAYSTFPIPRATACTMASKAFGSHVPSARSISESVSSPCFSMETPTEIVTRPRISPVDFFFNSYAITARRM